MTTKSKKKRAEKKATPAKPRDGSQPILHVAATMERAPPIQPGDQVGQVFWIHGDDSATQVRVMVNGLAATDAAKFGYGGVYVVIEGDTEGKPAPIATALERKDGTVCLYLDEPAKRQLLEQLQRHVEIVALHEAIARDALLGPRATITPLSTAPAIPEHVELPADAAYRQELTRSIAAYRRPPRIVAGASSRRS